MTEQVDDGISEQARSTANALNEFLDFMDTLYEKISHRDEATDD